MAPIAVAVGIMSAGLSGTLVGASTGRAFTATAEASGMYLRYSMPGYLPVENFIDGGGPVSQAVVTSDGGSQSFSSLPYPGATAIGAPGVFALVTQGQFVPPGYPFYVNAAYPTQPSAALADPSGAYSLMATAKDGEADGDSRVAPPGSGDTGQPVAAATSKVVSEADEVTATATSVSQAITAGPLSIGVVRSQSVTTFKNGDDKPTSTTDLRVEGGRAGDTAFSFGPQGLQVAQNGIPVPAGQGLAAINQALTPSGLSIRFAEPTAIQGGSQAGVLEITSVYPIPGTGTGTLRARLGGAMSFVTLGATEVNLNDNAPSATTTAGDTSPFPPAGQAASTLPGASSETTGFAGPSGDAGTAASPVGTDFTTSVGGATPAGGDTAPVGDATGGPAAASEAPRRPTVPAQLAYAPAAVHSTSGVASFLLLSLLVALALLGTWLWTTRRRSWTA
jgi:hypothetical protein